MRTEEARVGARGIDAVQSIDVVHTQGLKRIGVDFVVRYLGGVTPGELSNIVSAGLGFMPVTYASAHDGASAAAACKALNLPIGCTVWRDLEGPKLLDQPPDEIITDLNEWANCLLGAGYMPGLYVGAPQPLTSEELYRLKVVRYWKGQGRCVDRFNKLAEPNCGWCCWQMWPSQWAAGVWADYNAIGSDYTGRVPSWVVA